jgi:hypothetical protein
MAFAFGANVMRSKSLSLKLPRDAFRNTSLLQTLKAFRRTEKDFSRLSSLIIGKVQHVSPDDKVERRARLRDADKTQGKTSI